MFNVRIVSTTLFLWLPHGAYVQVMVRRDPESAVTECACKLAAPKASADSDESCRQWQQDVSLHRPCAYGAI